MSKQNGGGPGKVRAKRRKEEIKRYGNYEKEKEMEAEKEKR